jgi:hypothetical protein
MLALGVRADSDLFVAAPDSAPMFAPLAAVPPLILADLPVRQLLHSMIYAAGIQSFLQSKAEISRELSWVLQEER